MFWTLTAPVTIAFWGLIGCVIAATALAPRFAVKRSKAFALSAVFGALAFVPSCIGVNAVIAPFRFGVFHYDAYDDVNDWRVYRYLPKGVTDITLEKPAHGNGFRAKFAISRAELESWIDQQWALYGGNSELPRAKADSRRAVSGDEIAREFSDFAEPLPSDAVEYAGPVASNWAGLTIWYSEEQGIGYEDAGYW
jgi:hypothetical protein